MFLGLLLAICVAVLAYALGTIVPVVGGPVFGIVLGMLCAVMVPPGKAAAPGIRFASRELLQTSIVLLGATLQLGEIGRTGEHSLPVMLGTLIVTLAAAYVFGKLLGIDRDLRRLLGVGTAICGGSAIAALSSVIDVNQAEVAYALSTVFLFNVAAVLTFPWLGHWLQLSQNGFGLWAGTAINDTSSVVAAAFTYGHIAGNQAVIVKLTRTALIVPIVLFYAGKKIWRARSGGERANWRKIIPWFILWFLFAAIINTTGAIPSQVHPLLTKAALFLIIVALSAVGLSADAKGFKEAGFRPLALGGILWVLIAISSLVIAHFTHASA